MAGKGIFWYTGKNKTGSKGARIRMDVAFEGAHMIWDGVLCCTADDPEAYYAADARRVLELFVLAAEQGLELKADTLLAAAGAAPSGIIQPVSRRL